MSILIFIVVLSVIVLIHELGHFLAARAFGVKADEFGYGFPPRVIGWTRLKGRWKRVSPKDRTEYPNTIWSLNWLPFGGFVRIKGEEVDGLHAADSIHAKPIWQRIIILAAGVIMNWLLAIVLLTVVFSVGTMTEIEKLPQGAHITNRHVVVTGVVPGSPADGILMPGDEIQGVAGAPPQSAADVKKSIQEWIATQGARVTPSDSQVLVPIRIRRGAQDGMEFNLVPKYLENMKAQGLGIALADEGMVSFSVPQAFVQAVVYTATLTGAIVEALGGMVRDLWVTHTVSKDVSGPVGIAVLTGQVAKQGMAALLFFAAMLSVNLAVINFLPIPALDGGRVLFLIIEKIRRKPMDRELEIKIHNIAFLVLIALIVLVTARDVLKLFGR